MKKTSDSQEYKKWEYLYKDAEKIFLDILNQLVEKWQMKIAKKARVAFIKENYVVLNNLLAYSWIHSPDGYTSPSILSSNWIKSEKNQISSTELIHFQYLIEELMKIKEDTQKRKSYHLTKQANRITDKASGSVVANFDELDKIYSPNHEID